MRPLLLPLPGNEALAQALAGVLPADVGAVEVRRFPDEETYARIPGSLADRDTVIVATLDRPDPKLVPLCFVAATARDLGARRIGLVAPYLPYLRQDRRFRPGEALGAAYFARLLARAIDWVVTVDPHLHRLRALGDVYDVPAVAAHAAPLLARWIEEHVARPLLIGPDRESAQWIGVAAAAAGWPSLVLDKVRRGDRDVEVSVPGLARFPGHTPVLLDDIVSTGRTMAAAIAHLRRLGTPAPVCAAVHAVFAPGADDELRRAGAARVVTTNTIVHPSNAVDVSESVAAAVRAASGEP